MKKTFITGNSEITLRSLFVKDVTERYVNWMNDPDISQFLESRWDIHTLKSTREYVKSMRESPIDIMFGIFLTKGMTHIGNIKIGSINEKHKYADLGLIVGEKQYWGKGFGTQAIKLATEFAFSRYGLNKLIAGIYANNIGSYKAFINSGYRKVGVFKRHRIFLNSYVDQIIVEKCNTCYKDK
jgi:ribosomal-protein-alanine N-acetyltransferase